MSDTTTVDVRLTQAEFDNAERVIEQLQKTYPAMTVDDAIDFIFKVGTLHLHDQSVIDSAIRRKHETRTIASMVPEMPL